MNRFKSKFLKDLLALGGIVLLYTGGLTKLLFGIKTIGLLAFQLTFSNISNDYVFLYTNRLNSFGDLDSVQGSLNNYVSAGSEIQQIFDLTMCGAFSFIFCPDKDATNPEFAQCRLDQSSLSATQIAYQTWNISMNIVEVW